MFYIFNFSRTTSIGQSQPDLAKSILRRNAFKSLQLKGKTFLKVKIK